MIRTQDQNGLRIITLDRPDKANALTRPMLADLLQAFEQAQGARAVVLTGAGRVFSAGADLDAAKAGLARDPIWQALSAQIAALPCLTIAALNGTLAGGAFGMALACDLRLCVPGAAFFYPVMRLGYLPQPGDAQRLTALIGPARAKMILMGGARIDAPTALAFGLIDQIVDPDALMPAATALAQDALAASAGHVAAIKAMIP